MATIRPAQPVQSIAGRLGGLSFRRSTSIPFPVIDGPPLPTPNTDHPQSRASVVTARATQRKPRTPAQNRAANEARAVAALWRGLTDSDRDEWNVVAAALQLTENPDSIGQWSGWALFSAVHRRYALAGVPGPTTPEFFGNPRVDRPWIKAFAAPTLGTIRVFLEPVSFPYPEPGSIGCLYASPPRPGTRVASARRSAFVASFDPVNAIGYGSAFDVEVAPASLTPPGAIVDLRAVTATSNGQASNLWSGRVKFPATGWGLAGIWWTYSTLASFNGVELTSDRLLHVWSLDYPDGTPDTLDLLHPSEKTVGNVLSFLGGATFTDTRVINAGLLSRPQSDLPVIPKQRRSHASSVLPLFARL